MVMLVTGRTKGSQHAEILHMSKEESYFMQPRHTFPIQIYNAAFCQINQTIHLMGGNLKRSNEISNICWKFQKKRWKISSSLLVKRSGLRCMSLDEDAIWVTGGFDGVSHLKSTEILQIGDGSLTKPEKGPNLPARMSHHAMVKLDRNNILIIGGYDGKYKRYKCANAVGKKYLILQFEAHYIAIFYCRFFLEIPSTKK